MLVVGGGAAGLTAARESTRRGARTTLVTDGPLGGDCTFFGCIPSKALLVAAARGASFAEASEAVRTAISRIAATEDDAALQRQGINVMHGRARLRSPTEVEVDGSRIRATRIIIATGARPAIPTIDGLDSVAYLTNENVFSLERLPERLAVIGGGATGCELAQAFARLGSRVTVIETAPRLLPNEEPEASAIVAEALATDGADICVNEQVARVEGTGPHGAVTIHLGSGATISAERVLVATGRRPVTDGLGLADVGVDLDEKGNIRTDDALATSARGIWAIGDVTGRMPFTHAGARMAYVAVRNALSRMRVLRTQRFDHHPIPWVTYTSPEVGRVGMTEAQAADRHARVAFLPLTAVDRAVVSGQTAGFVKLIAGPRRVFRNAGGGQLLGVTIVAPSGGELVHEAALAMRTRMFTGRLAQTTHAYPSWSMAIQQAAAMFFFDVDGHRARPARK